MCAKYNSTPDEKLAEPVRTSIDSARLTLVEYELVQALLVAEEDERVAIAAIKAQTQRLEKANQSSLDVHQLVWASCQKLLNGESFK